MPSFRRPRHAGSWYSDHPQSLQSSIDSWLQKAADDDTTVPFDIKGRVIIAPHAGYAYSGPCAAYAYNALDLSECSHIYLLGPSHHLYSSHILLPHPSITAFKSPLSPNPIPYDTQTITNLRNSDPSIFTTMTPTAEEREHSLEMHLPFLHRLLQRQHPDDDDDDDSSTIATSYPKLIPLMVGATSPATERKAGHILAPYFADPHAAIIVSSDFCHWGSRFSYTFYSAAADHPGPSLPLSAASLPQPAPLAEHPADAVEERVARLAGAGIDLESVLRSKRVASVAAAAAAAAAAASSSSSSSSSAAAASSYSPPPWIHESISAVDMACMAALTLPCRSTTHAGGGGDEKEEEDDDDDDEGEGVGETDNALTAFYAAMRRTDGNTICGRHPIAVVLNALAKIVGGGDDEFRGRFRFLRYERSSDVVDARDSSVSYVSAVATL